MKDSVHFQRLEALFHELDELSGEALAKRLDALAQDEPELHAELVRLLEPSERRERDEKRLDSVAGSGGLAASLSEPAVPSDPEAVGPYRLVRPIGEGGMGRVYLAEQTEPVRRRVALKLTRRGLDSQEAMARFRAERQALAVLEHPNIARVFDAGSLDDGRPWFAMEYIEGQPITAWAAERGLDLSERIELLLPVCEAVQHAHRKGLIHRDLKPSNLLVVDQGGQAVPKVIDFGIARVLEADAEDRTQVTRLGELIGTPEYMSPEQAALGEVDIDTRSDVYSLGLVLYELLVGTLPMTGKDLRALGFEAMCRQIREGDTPRPSRVQAAPETLADATTQRWRSRLKGDLDSVLLKALAKDRERRYGSAADLADDLKRYLANEPVVAQPPSLRYRAGKFVRRHRWPVAAGTGIALALVAGMVVALFGLQQAREAERAAVAAAEEARAERQTAEETTSFMVDLFRAADPANEPGLDATAEDLLARGETRIDQLAGQPHVQAELLASLGSAYYGLGELTRAEALLRRARTLRDTGPAADAYKRAAIDSRLADLLRERSEYAEAADAYRAALDTLDGLGGLDDSGAIVLLNGLGVSQLRIGEVEAAEATFQRALGLLDALPDSDGEALAERRNHRLNLLSSLAGLYALQGRNADAAAATREVLGVLGSILPDTHPNIAILHANLSVLLALDGDLVAADREARRSVALSLDSLGADHPRTAGHRTHAGLVQWRIGDFDEAESNLREAIGIYTRQFGTSHLELVRPKALLARVLARTDRLDEGLEQAREAVRIASENADALPTANRIDAVLALSGIELARGELDAAWVPLREAAALEGIEAADEGRLQLAEARVIAASGRIDEAMERLAEVESTAACPAEPCALDHVAKGPFLAQALAEVGHRDAAFEALDRAVRHPGWARWMLTLPAFEGLRDEPRWQDVQQALDARSGEAGDAG